MQLPVPTTQNSNHTQQLSTFKQIGSVVLHEVRQKFLENRFAALHVVTNF